jgi:hypothetical protein
MSEDRPLISGRSPSYERAQERHGEPVPEDARAIAALGRLVEAELDAAGALRAAGRDDEADEHDGLAGKLGALIQELGGAAPRPGEGRAILTHGADEVARAGDVEDVLRRMREELAAEHERAAADGSLAGVREQLAALRS